MMMKHLKLILLLSLIMPLTALAAEGNPHAIDTTKHVELLTKELGLNADQQVKVKAIFDAQQEKLKAIHEETKTSLQAVLTPEQSAKLDAAHEKHKQARKDKAAGKK
jgi:Spy/CpxP family protein refolding chaperone